MMRFIFEFYDDIPHCSRRLGFEFIKIPKRLESWVKAARYHEPDDYQEILDELEDEFGCHDFVVSGYNEIFGYCSSEVKYADQFAVMNKWKDFFTQKGLKTGPIVVLTEEYHPDQERIGV